MNKKLVIPIMLVLLCAPVANTRAACVGCAAGLSAGATAAAVVGGALTGAAIAASNEPRTVVVGQSVDNTSQVRNLQRENRDLQKQIDRQERQIRRLERKLEIA